METKVEDRMVESTIEISVDQSRSYISKTYATFPLKFMHMRKGNPANVDMYIIRHGGGSSPSGENLTISLKKDSVANIFTNRVSKIYNKFGTDCCLQKLNIDIQSGATLVYLPDPTQLYQCASVRRNIQYHISQSASLVAIDWFSTGSKEPWAIERLQSTSQITINKDVEQRTSYTDCIDLFSCSNSTAAEKIHGASVFGSLLLSGSKTKIVRDLAKRQEKNFYAKGFRVEILDVNSFAAMGLTIIKFWLPSLEDAYWVVATLLAPLSTELGYVAFSDKVIAASPSSWVIPDVTIREDESSCGDRCVPVCEQSKIEKEVQPVVVSCKQSSSCMMGEKRPPTTVSDSLSTAQSITCMVGSKRPSTTALDSLSSEFSLQYTLRRSRSLPSLSVVLSTPVVTTATSNMALLEMWDRDSCRKRFKQELLLL